MVIEKESVRYFAEDQEEVFDWSGTTAAAAWNVEQTYNNLFTITKPSLFVFAGSVTITGTGNGGIRLRLQVGAVDYYVGGVLKNGDGSEEFEGIAYIPAGTYSLFIEGQRCAGNVAIEAAGGITNFSDLTGDLLDRSLAVAVPAAGVVVTTQNIAGILRRSVIGTIRKHVIRVQVFAKDSDAGGPLQGQIQPGAPGGAAVYAFWLQIGGVDVPITQVSVHIDNAACMRCNYGEWWIVADIEDTQVITIRAESDVGGPYNVDFYWSIAACPWFSSGNLLSPTNYGQPVLINLPPASTINLLQEPLERDETGRIGLATNKAHFDGSNEKVYDVTTGTDILHHSDTLTDLPSHGLYVYNYGYRRALTVIVADRRG